jgi:hypothetical protein
MNPATSMLVLVAGAAAGCAGGTRDAAAPATPPPLEWSAQRGPLEVRVRAAPAEASVGERITLTVDLWADAGVAVTMPRIGDALGDFTVLERSTPPDVPEGARRRLSHRYVLSTFGSGQVEIPSLEFAAADPEGAAAPEAIRSDPLVVSVASLLEPGVALEDFAAIRGAVEVPVPGAPWWLAWPAGAVAGLTIAFLLWRRRRGTAAAAVPPPLPHEWARRELAALAAADLVRQERFHEFFVRLSDIVRRYLELRYGLSAPERTTAEFIREMGGHPVLGPEHQRLLAEFLRAADLVKFALHRPPAREAEAALAAAGGFVEQTAPPGPAREAAA